MRATYKSKISIPQLEAHMRSLRCEPDVDSHVLHLLPERLKVPPKIMVLEEKVPHWAAYAWPYENGWRIVTPSTRAVWTYTPLAGGTEIHYDGPFLGCGGSSPFILGPAAQELGKAEVVATGFRGTMKQYLQHRLKYVRIEHDEGYRLSGANMPQQLIDAGVRLVIQWTEAVEGFENLWSATRPRMYWEENPAPARLHHVGEKVILEPAPFGKLWLSEKEARPFLLLNILQKA